MANQMAELHYLDEPIIDAKEVASRAEELAESGIEVPPGKDGKSVQMFFHTKYAAQFSDGSVPAQTVIMSPGESSEKPDYSEDIQQSWGCTDASERLAACSTTRLVTEMTAAPLPPIGRALIFHGVLQAVIEISKPHAIVFKHSQQVVDPSAYLASCGDQPILRPGSLNVRFYNISNSGGDDQLEHEKEDIDSGELS